MLIPDGLLAEQTRPENNLEALPRDHSPRDGKGGNAEFAREKGTLPYKVRTARSLPGHTQNRRGRNGRKKGLAEKKNSDKNE